MIQRKWLILLTLLLAMAWCGSVVAGPKYPSYGDPDIVEGTRPHDGSSPRLLSGISDEPLVIEIPFLGRVVFGRQVQRDDQLRKKAERLPAACRKDRIR
jgi:hypothetical protein